LAAEIAGQPEAIRRAARAAAEQADALSEAAADRGGALVLSGMGSSYDACYPATTALAEAGVPAIMVDAAELLHFRMGMLHERDTLVLVSQSGESAETVRVAERLRDGGRGPRIVAITNGATNRLAAAAHVSLDTRAGVEAGPSTMTFAAAVVLLAAFTRARGAGARASDPIATLPADAEMTALAVRLLVDDEALPERLVEWRGARAATVLLGRGAARAAAEMGALTLKEVVGVPVESLQTAQFRHGPLELAGPGLAAIVIATERATRDLDLALARELQDLGSSVLTITADGRSGGSLDVGPLDRTLSPAASVVPAQLLAWRLAHDRGRVPGSYVHAAKVTTRE
jgi:glucosamine--fructose-6-phosphate aminotransferase (isomerizing)